MSEEQARRLVAERSGGVCEVCYAARASNFHHRIPEGQGGPWAAGNGLAVCGSGTLGCHGWIEHNRAAAYIRGWLVHTWDDPEQVPVLLRYYGWARLDNQGTITEGVRAA